MNKTQWKGIICFLSLPALVFAITSVSYMTPIIATPMSMYAEYEMVIAMKGIEYSLLAWICFLAMGISFICLLGEE